MQMGIENTQNFLPSMEMRVSDRRGGGRWASPEATDFGGLTDSAIDSAPL
jgi:hypothetical protein